VPGVLWLDVRERSTSLVLHANDVGKMLSDRLFGRTPCVIATSATLSTSRGGQEHSFRFIRSRLGAPADADELVVPSPFDYPARAGLYLPTDLPEPSDGAFAKLSLERIVELLSVTQGGAFVLCTSTKAMRAFGDALRKRVTWQVLVQGEGPKETVLERFRSDGNAVLCATMTFWEGVDVPGKALRLVILDKLPFAVPTDPVTIARVKQIEEEGGNAFIEYHVPTAAITLKQGFGRLIRTAHDCGIVAILDHRVLTKPYGRALLRGLPAAKRLGSVDDVRAFWQAVVVRPTAS
jgi:ATP-dependent DNA helicase DinG